MRLRFGLVAALCLAACTATGSDVRTMRADTHVSPTTSPTPPVTDATIDTIDTIDTVDTPDTPDTTAAAIDLDSLSFVATGTPVDGGADGVTSIPDQSQQDEAVVHSIVADVDGWLAVGSITTQPTHGLAAVWTITPDGAAGAVQPLPALRDGEPSVARAAVVTGESLVVVGQTGSGTNSTATAWRRTAAGWDVVEIPNDPSYAPGAIADHIVALADGSLVVVGRGDGPSFNTLLTWSSTDRGATWTEATFGFSTYADPLVATDGTRVLVVTDDVPGDDGSRGHQTLIFTEGPSGLDVAVGEAVNPEPGNDYHMRSMIWDGTQYVIGLDSVVGPMLAESVDGTDFSIVTLGNGRDIEDTDKVTAMVLIDGLLDVFISRDHQLVLLRGDDRGNEFDPVEIPPMPAGNMEYLDERAPIASDGSQAVYISVTWDDRSMLTWDGTGWTGAAITGIPPHRNPSRLGVREIATAGGADLVSLAEETATGEGGYQMAPSDLLLRPAGSDQYQRLDVTSSALFLFPTAIAGWGDAFYVAGLDPDVDSTLWFRVDPTTLEFRAVSVTPGFVESVVGGADGLYARIRGDDGVIRLWSTVDGNTWHHAPTSGEPHALCTDGTHVVIEWADAQGSMGLQAIVAGRVVDIGSDLSVGASSVYSEYFSSSVCGVNADAVMSFYESSDIYRFDDVPARRLVHWADAQAAVNDRTELALLNIPGSWQTWVRAVHWTGSEWIAVGETKDIEAGWDLVMWRSADGRIWPGPVMIAGGPGNQLSGDMVIDGDQIVIGGLDRQEARIWRIPIAAS